MSLLLKSVTSDEVSNNRSFDLNNIDPFTQLSINQLIQNAAKSCQPVYVLAVATLAVDGCLAEDARRFALYDGISFWKNHAISKGHSTDPCSRREIEKVQYFALRELSKSQGTADTYHFDQLTRIECNNISKAFVALDEGNSYLSWEHRIRAAALVAEGYLQLFKQNSSSVKAQTFLGRAKNWVDFIEHLCTVCEGKNNLTARDFDEIVSIKKIINMYSEFSKTMKPNRKRLSAKERREAERAIVDFLKVQEHGIEVRKLLETISFRPLAVKSALQKLEHDGIVLSQGKGRKRVVFVKPKPSFDEAIGRIGPSTDLEASIMQSPDWIEGVRFGKVRQGHPEGEVIYHILEILENIDMRYDESDPLVPDLRILAMVHDSFKHQVQCGKAKVGANHHGYYAKMFMSKFIDDEEFLEVVRRHDEAYYIWRNAKRTKDWDRARDMIFSLLENFPQRHQLYKAFYECDCKTGNKKHTPYEWFEKVYYEWCNIKFNSS